MPVVVVVVVMVVVAAALEALGGGGRCAETAAHFVFFFPPSKLMVKNLLPRLASSVVQLVAAAVVWRINAVDSTGLFLAKGRPSLREEASKQRIGFEIIVLLYPVIARRLL